MTCRHVKIVDKLFAGENLHPNVVSSCNSPGLMVFCEKCLDKHHLAPWRTQDEVVATVSDFTNKHKDCT